MPACRNLTSLSPQFPAIYSCNLFRNCLGVSMDPYKILGIDANATPEEIRRAYRKMAKKYHPDSGGDVRAFQQVQQAHAILTGKASRPPTGKPKQPDPGSPPSSAGQSPHDQPNPSSSTGNQGPFQSAGPTYTGPQSSHAPFTRAMPIRRRKRDNTSVQVIGAIGGGICALGFALFLLKSQFAPQWASFKGIGPDSSNSPGSSVTNSQRVPPKSNTSVPPAPTDRNGLPNSNGVGSNRPTSPSSNPGIRQPSAAHEDKRSDPTSSASPIRRGAMTKNSPEDTQWILEFAKQATPKPKNGRLPVSQTIAELKQ